MSLKPPLQAIVGEVVASSITVPKPPLTLLSVGAVELGGGGSEVVAGRICCRQCCPKRYTVHGRSPFV
jgi:hypothetical protein